jgi:hypothetical protein
MWSRKEDEHIGHIIVKYIWAIKVPHDLTGIQQQLGLAQQAREYVRLLSRILEPIQTLARKDVNVGAEWKKEQDDALRLLKEALTAAPFLLKPDLLKRFMVCVDACLQGRGIGVLLKQQHENGEEVYGHGAGMHSTTRCHTTLEMLPSQRAHIYGVSYRYALIFMIIKPGEIHTNDFTDYVPIFKGIHLN